MAKDFEAFVRAWQKADSVSEAAKQLDMTNAICSRTAFYLRKRGVPLKVFKVRGSKDTIKALAALAESLA